MKYNDPAHPNPLVSVDWLAFRTNDPRVRIVDARAYLKDKRGIDEYNKKHIPGAVFVDLHRDLARDPSRGPGRHPLPEPEAFASLLERLGVEESTIVVAYDDTGGAMAARLWWLLRYFGHIGGRVLDGGIGAWIAAGHGLTTDVPIVTPAKRLELRPGNMRVVDKLEVKQLAASPSAVVLDARASDRYEGLSEPIDPRAGHIPGAVSAPFVHNLVAPGGVMRLPTDLESHYRALGALDPDKTVVCYCGSGVTACHDLLALAMVGRHDAALYEGSWSDWSSDTTLPVATGPDAG